MMKSFIFILVSCSFVLKASTSSKCGMANCICSIAAVSEQQVSRRNLMVNCRGQKIRKISSVQLNMMRWKALKLDLGQNLIYSIDSNAFAQQTNLQKLVLDNNYIEDVNIASLNVSESNTNEWVSPLEYIDLRSKRFRFDRFLLSHEIDFIK